MRLSDLYKIALEKKFSIGAFNFYNAESLKSILNAAKKTNRPVICACSSSAIKFMGTNFLKNLIIAARKEYEVPFFIHLDHGSDFEICKTAIGLGFDSVMIDGSSLPLQDNIKLTKKVCDYAHKRQVQVEGELGRLAGVEDEVTSKISLYTNPDEAKEFVEKTNVDSLAIAIGTSHGINKFTNEPHLEIEVLKKIEKLLPDTALVLHGASSVDDKIIEEINLNGGNIKKAKGVPAEILKFVSTKHNICKINVDTDLRMATTCAIRNFLNQNPSEIDPRKYLTSAMEKCQETVEHKILNVFCTKEI